MGKKLRKKVIASIIAILLVITFCLSLGYNVKDREVLVFQLGKLVKVHTDEGVYFKVPYIQSTTSIFVGERIYDIPRTNVTTSDKKTMICDAYATWQVTDIKKYYSKLSSVQAAQDRLNASVYSSIKNVISSTSQDEVISGKDGSLGRNILKKTNLESYGISVTNIEIKVLDLPDDNKDSVYKRMISERQAIAAKYTADGEKKANMIKSQTNANVRTIKSNAKAEAADVIADGETQYYKILSDAYSKSEDKTDFYKYWSGLEALKETLQNGGTYVINEDSPLYEFLINK